MHNMYMEVGGNCGGYFRRNLIFGTESSNQAIRDIFDQTGGSDAYYCTYLFDNKERGEGTKYYSPLYFDIDGDITTDKGFEDLRLAVLSLVANLSMELRLKSDEIKYYFSGSKGFHVFVSAKKLCIKPYEKLNVVYKAFVQYMQRKMEHGELLDTKIYDNKRLIRIPASINAKTGLYKIPVHYSELRTITRKELLEKAKTKQPDCRWPEEPNMEAAARFRECIQKIWSDAPRKNNRHSIIPETKQSLPICMRYLLQADVSRGGRNNYIAMLASILVQNGYRPSEALEVLEAWNSNLGEPLEENEVQATLMSAVRMAQEGRGYGCASIREKGVFPPRQVCPACRIYQRIQKARGG